MDILGRRRNFAVPRTLPVNVAVIRRLMPCNHIQSSTTTCVALFNTRKWY